MSTIDPTLAEHTIRLLVGTDLPATSALDVAAGRTPAPGTVAAALRDGWDAARPVATTLTVPAESVPSTPADSASVDPS